MKATTPSPATCPGSRLFASAAAGPSPMHRLPHLGRLAICASIGPTGGGMSAIFMLSAFSAVS
jgi:hypothetical protein